MSILSQKKYKLVVLPSPVLREISAPVENISGDTIKKINSLVRMMRKYKGIGFAAPQAGISERIIVVDTGEDILPMINPEIVTGFGADNLEEGCLSVPETAVEIERKTSIYVNYTNLNEKPTDMEFTGLTARVIQHEVDHLNGILIVDYQHNMVLGEQAL